VKTYYPKVSDLWQDSERMRKVLSDFMRKNNPEYIRNPAHNTPATPIPADAASIYHHPLPAPIPGPIFHEPVGVPIEQRSRSVRIDRPVLPETPYNVAPANNGSSRATRAVQAPAGKKNDFTGLTFQQIQEKLVEELYEVTDKE
jgi:hypothetical protein